MDRRPNIEDLNLDPEIFFADLGFITPTPLPPDLIDEMLCMHWLDALYALTRSFAYMYAEHLINSYMVGQKRGGRASAPPLFRAYDVWID